MTERLSDVGRASWVHVAGLVSEASFGVHFPRLSQSNTKADRRTEPQLPSSALPGIKQEVPS